MHGKSEGAEDSKESRVDTLQVKGLVFVQTCSFLCLRILVGTMEAKDPTALRRR